MKAIIVDNLDDIVGNIGLIYEGKLLDDSVLAYFNSKDKNVYVLVTDLTSFETKNKDKVTSKDKSAEDKTKDYTIDNFEVYYTDIPQIIYESATKTVHCNEAITMTEFK